MWTRSALVQSDRVKAVVTARLPVTVSVAQSLGRNVKVNAACPGWVRTRMGGQGASRSPEKGAETPVWLATLPDNGPTGGFYRDRKLIEW